MRNIKTVVLAVIIIMFGASFMPVKKTQNPVKAAAPIVFRDYVWFYDYGYTAPVGSTCDINVEIARLQALFGGFTFSASSAGFVQPFEYGYFPGTLPTIIYSDLDCY